MSGRGWIRPVTDGRAQQTLNNNVGAGANDVLKLRRRLSGLQRDVVAKDYAPLSRGAQHRD